jgi:putative FmdB family regulatory protein
MPTYVYGPKGAGKGARSCDVCCGTFEIVQRMSDAALTVCPKCGADVERVILAPNLNGAGKFKKPTDDRLAKAGFTQYKKKGKGYYEKSFGSGPQTLNP